LSRIRHILNENVGRMDIVSLVTLVHKRALNHPQKTAFTYLRDGEKQAQIWTLGQLDKRVRKVAAALNLRAGIGERVLLLLPPGPEFIIGFLACQYAQLVPVPLPQPRYASHFERVGVIAADAQAAIILVNRVFEQQQEHLLNELLSTSAVMNLEQLQDEGASDWYPEMGTLNALAFLQYTSGSTGNPKGVMVSHANVAANSRFIAERFGYSTESISVTWLPPFHDMGLIDGIIQPLYHGFHTIIMPPFAFLRRPWRWLKAISQYRATHSGGPNFAYQLCISRTPDRILDELNLDSWKIAYNGAEPIDSVVTDRFIEKFSARGFHKQALYPCYGLAEATLKVSGGSSIRRPSDITFSAPVSKYTEDSSRKIVACGEPDEQSTLMIVCPDTRIPMQDNHVGEIWVSGPSVACGYWNNKKATEHYFEARLAGKPGDQQYLRTGDMGFLADKQLYIAGRLKDLIIIRGRNIFPNDVEKISGRSHSLLNPDNCSAFSVNDAGSTMMSGETPEQLIVMCECRVKDVSESQLITKSVRLSIVKTYELEPSSIILVKPNTIPRTTSGKIMRFSCRELYLNDMLTPSFVWKNTQVLESTVDGRTDAEGQDQAQASEIFISYLKKKLQTEDIPLDATLTDLGLDSLSATEIVHNIEVKTAIGLPVLDVQNIKIEQLLKQLSVKDANLSASKIDSFGSDNHSNLSRAEASIWLLNRLWPETDPFFNTLIIRFQSVIESNRLNDAFAQLQQCHPILNSIYIERDGLPWKKTLSERQQLLNIIDARDYTSAMESAEIKLFSQSTWCLNEFPPLKAKLFDRNTSGSVLCICVHHVTMDLWSLRIFLQDLILAYEKGVGSLPVPTRLSITADSEFFHSKKTHIDQCQQYWKTQLNNAPLDRGILSDYPRPQKPLFTGASMEAWLNADTKQRLNLIAKTHRLPLNSILFAAFILVCNKNTQENDIVVGTPIHSRHSAELREAIGLFSNMVPIRVNIPSRCTLNDLLSLTDETIYFARKHQPYTLDQIIGERGDARQTSRLPTLKLMFAYEQVPSYQEEGVAAIGLGVNGQELKIRDVLMSSVAHQPARVYYDIAGYVFHNNKGLSFVVQYNAEIFSDMRIAHFIEHYQQTLEAIISSVEQPVDNISLLAKTERHEVLERLSGVSNNPPAIDNLHSLFEQQVKINPNRVALISGNENISYAELERLSANLAAKLLSIGIRCESRVAIHCHRSTQMVVAMLAVLRAGATYVPLDPHYPQSRLDSIVVNSAARYVLTDERGSSERFCVPEIHIDDIESTDSGIKLPRVLPQALAYILYTSGSTGQPKGVCISHSSVVSFVRWAASTYNKEELREVVASTSICFDLSIFEIFVPLTSGGAVHIIDNILSLIEKKSNLFTPSLVSAVPSAMRAVLAQGALPKSIKAVNLAGELLSAKLADSVLNTIKGVKLYDLYGPSEATTYATYVRRRTGDYSSIGRPLSQVSVYILGKNNEPVAWGVPGEIHLGGNQLARGYSNRADLTAMCFIPHPFSDIAGQRLYRTGDKGRFLPDGRLVYMGRVDRQLKVRGYRIEPEEIEEIISCHQQVKEVVVIPSIDSSENVLLVAFLVLENENMLNRVKTYISSQLPGYMVPAKFIVLEQMPKTPNGKVDQKALSANSNRYFSKKILQGPNETPSAVEQQIIGICSAIIGCQSLQLDDDFFQCGGNSLMVPQVINELLSVFNVQLPMAAVFESPTARELAEKLVDSQHQPKKIPSKVKYSQSPPLSFSQQRVWYLQKLVGTASTYHICLSLSFSCPVHVDRLETAINKVVACNDALRYVFNANNGIPSCKILDQVAIKVKQTDLGEEYQRPDDFESYLKSFAAQPIDIYSGPMLNIELIKRCHHRDVVALAIHHIVVDGASMVILIDQLLEFYERDSVRAQSAASYAAFAHQEQSSVNQGSAFTKSLGYWQQQLENPTMSAFPVDYLPSLTSISQGNTKHYVMPSTLLQKTKNFEKRYGVTAFMSHLSVLIALIHKVTGKHDIAVGTPVGLRHECYTEHMIGMFVQPMVVRIKIPVQASFVDIVNEVRNTTLAGLSHLDVPYEEIVKAVNPLRRSAGDPFFSVLFVHEQGLHRTISTGFGSVESRPISSNTAREDISFFVERSQSENRIAIEYCVDLYAEQTIDKIASDYIQTLEVLVECPQRSLLSVNVDSVSKSEKEVAVDTVQQSECWLKQESTPLPDRVLQIWEEVVAEPATEGVSFFDQGGHSLLAVHFLTRLEDSLGVKLSLREFLENSTPAALSGLLSDASRGDVEPLLPPVKVAREKSNAPLSSSQRQIWWLQKIDPGSSCYNTPCVLQLNGTRIDIAKLERAFVSVIRRHSALRTAIIEEDNQVKQSVFPADTVNFKMQISDAEAMQYKSDVFQYQLQEEINRPFNLAQPPLIRARLFTLASDESLLVMTLHHIIVDAWSLDLILRELGAAYSDPTDFQQRVGVPVLDNVDYAQWEQSWIQSPVVIDAVDQWREHLMGTPINLWERVASNKTDKQRIFVTHRFISVRLHEQLKNLSRITGGTLAHCFLTAYALLLRNLIAREDFIIGLPTTTRRFSGFENTVGFFSNTVPLRFDLDPGVSAMKLIEHVRESTLQSYQLGWVPLEKIAELFAEERELAPPQLFQAAFVMYASQSLEELFDGCSSTFIPSHTQSEKFDLMISIYDQTDGVHVQLESNTGKFSSTKSDKLIDHLLDILETISTNPHELVIQKARQTQISKNESVLSARSVILSKLEVLDCVILDKKNKYSNDQQVAYIQSAVACTSKKLTCLLSEQWPDDVPKPLLVPVTHLPYTRLGEIDDVALRKIPVFDPETMANIQQMEKTLSSDKENRVKLKIRPDLWSEQIRDVNKSTPQLNSGVLAVTSGDSGASIVNRIAYLSGGRFLYPEDTPQDLVSAIKQEVLKQSHRGIHFVSRDKTEYFMSYAQLLDEALVILGGLQALGARQGDTMILQLEEPRRHLPVFWALILGGMHPATVMVPPVYDLDNSVTQKLLATWQLLQCPPIICVAEASRALEQFGQSYRNKNEKNTLQIIDQDQLVSEPATTYEPQPNDIAFKQLSSGSTGVPKCIPITHQGIIHQSMASVSVNGRQEHDVSCNWLPLDHVVPMAIHLADVILGRSGVFIDTDAVLASPLLWCDKMQQHKVTHSWAPNFGFKLLNDALVSVPNQRWNLSSLRRMMNAGELVIPHSVKQFRLNSARAGFNNNVHQSAFGMAETCTCICYDSCDTAHTPSRPLYVLRRSIGSALEFSTTASKDSIGFMSVGKPLPGIELRITDANQRTLVEGEIGHLQISGKVITSGYLYNDEANKEAFKEDGWFDSGDLAFMYNEALYVTGRVKETIIINGINYGCQEIEHIVYQIPDVAFSRVAAVAFRQPQHETESLAIFYVLGDRSAISSSNVSSTIAANVAEKVGVAVTVSIELAEEQFSRTTSGKIQRNHLRRQIENGVYGKIPQKSTKRPRFANYAHRQIWRAVNLPESNLVLSGWVLFFDNNDRFSREFCTLLSRQGINFVRIAAGERFSKISSRHYEVSAANVNDYTTLLEKLSDQQQSYTHIVHTWSCDCGSEPRNQWELKSAQEKGVQSLLALSKALPVDKKIGILVVSRALFAAKSDADVNWWMTPLIGFIRSLRQEKIRLTIRHIDLSMHEKTTDAGMIISELTAVTKLPEVAWRGAVRLYPRIENVGQISALGCPDRLKENGLYMITGGQGAIGQYLAQYLIQHVDCRVLLINRSNVIEKGVFLDNNRHRVHFISVDVNNAEALESAVSEVERQYGRVIDAVFHLAGKMELLPIDEQTPDQLWDVIKPKLNGGLSILQLLRTRANTRLTAFSSLSGLLGGALASSYAAACSGLDGLVQHLRAHGGGNKTAISWAWGAWHNLGMSQQVDASVRLSSGMLDVQPTSGLEATFQIPNSQAGTLYVGLDEKKFRVRQMLNDKNVAIEGVSIEGDDSDELLSSYKPLYDQFGTQIPINIKNVYSNLPAFNRSYQANNPLESAIVEIWKNVLGTHVPASDISFFELGGTSMSLSICHTELEKIFSRPITMVDLFQYSTVERLSAFIGSEGEVSISGEHHSAPIGRKKGRLRRRRTRP
jgi:amino acid adenylation domain-containing protein